MTLTVPQSNARPGRAPQIRVEADQTGTAVAQLGEVMNRVGTRIVEDRLTRATARAETDFARDIGELRLEFDQITDPDLIDAEWGPRVADLKARHAGSQDVRVKDKLDIAFDRLSNSHANALGARAIALGQEQREADWVTYRHDVLNQASRVDPDTRNELLSTGLGKIDALVAANTITADEGARRKIALIGDADNASAISLITDDPATFLSAAEQGIYDGLGAETLAQRRVQAQSRLDAIAAAELVATDRAARERQSEIGDFLTDAGEILKSGRPLANAARLDDPEVQAHPKYAEAAAARDLAQEIPNLAFLPPVDLRRALDIEQQKPAQKPYELARQKVLADMVAAAETGWKTDQVGYANSLDNALSFPDLPPFDPAQPQAYAKGLQARLRHSAWLTGSQYGSELAVFDEDERAEFNRAVAVDADPRTRVAMAGALAAGLAGAPELAERMIDDPVFLQASGLLAAGGSPRLTEDIFRGQQVLDQGNIVLPPVKDRLTPLFAFTADLFSDLPEGEALQSGIMETADALYAARVRRVDPAGDIDQEVYRQALHEVVGGTGRYDDAKSGRGGIAAFNGRATILPPEVSVDDLKTAMTNLGIAKAKKVRGYDRNDFTPEDLQRHLIAASLGGRAPSLDGNPITDRATIDDLEIRAVGPDTYVFVYPFYNGDQVLGTDDGQEYRFSMTRLVAESGK